ncbi:hypothetical protein LOTGIDRAFT_51730, partial [Lottia gigantea]
KTMEQLTSIRQEKRANLLVAKQNAQALARKITIEVLAKEWLADNQATVEMRAYLVDKLLPTLILGVEKLLTVVDSQSLAEKERDANFNPLDFLAQYLLRNNPRFSNFPEASPYVRGLRQVSEDLRNQLFNLEDNRLAKIKADVKRRREDRERQQEQQLQEKERRSTLLLKQFTEWNVAVDGKVELSLFQNALRSFTEITEHFPEELKKASQLGHTLEPTDETGRMLTLSEFVQFMNEYISELPTEIFEQFMEHMSKCAAAYRASNEREQRRILLSNLFIKCDHSGIAQLDRHRILNLFEQFWDQEADDHKKVMRNPRKWPVVEVDEADDTVSDDEEDPLDNKADTEELSPETATDAQEPAAETQDIVVDQEPMNDTEEPATDVQESVAEKEEPLTETATESQEAVAQSEDVPKTNEQASGKELCLTITSRSQSQMSAFDENSLNVSQFVQLTETFLGDDPRKEIFAQLLKFIKNGYEETEEEKMDRLKKARREAVSAKRKTMIDVLFEKWDNDGSGFLDLEEVENVMLKYKDGQEAEAIYFDPGFDPSIGWDYTFRLFCPLCYRHKIPWGFQDQRLSKREFRMLVLSVVQEIPGSETFDSFLEFLTNSVERSYSDRIRGEARKKWLQQIVTAAETGAASMEPVYRAVFQALYKAYNFMMIFQDAEAHGGGKKICASISMSERNTKYPQRGDTCLRYVAVTPEDADYMLDKCLYKDMKGVSFSALESGKPIHVPRVANHGNIYFWNTHRRPEEREGSFIVIPLKDKRKRTFGLLGIDTIADPHTKAIFITHEIQFFQGIAKAFSIAYHHIDMRKKLLRITESAISWIQRRSPHVREVVEYMAEPSIKGPDYVLRKMLATSQKGSPEYSINPPRLERKDNLFRDYLFKCVDNSETVTADAYGERHLAFPLRDDEGKAIALVDISIGDMKKLPPHENKEIQRMLRILQMAHKEITKEFHGAEKLRVLEGEQNDETRTDIMFDRLMLMELRDNVSKLDKKAYAELRSYKDPPQIIRDILKATLAIFYFE